MIKKYKNPLSSSLREIRYKVIRLKYFLLVVAAMFLEIIVLIVYLLSNENILKIDFFNLKILFAIISAVIVLISIGIIILLRLDRNKDRDMLEQYRRFKRDYYKITNNHLSHINKMVKDFDRETHDVDHKIELAILISNLYKKLIDDFCKIQKPKFLENAFEKEKEHFLKEQFFFDRFASFEGSERLQSIICDSDILHSSFLKEMNRIESNLKIVM